MRSKTPHTQKPRFFRYREGSLFSPLIEPFFLLFFSLLCFSFIFCPRIFASPAKDGPQTKKPDLPAPASLRLDESFFKAFEFRSLGPYRCGSWVTDFAVPEKPAKEHLYTFYVGTRNGGVWKTTNNGTTFFPVFDDQEYLSIGAIALAPSAPEIVYVGTGEAYCTRSTYRGNGVYKSLDGGQTWKHLGLEETHHIARIVIHPENPDIVYVAAMGHLFGPNPERGVFKTTDGGQTWSKVLYINDKVGVIDLVMNRQNPNILYAATYEKYRFPWTFEEGGPESGIYKTIDGGQTWKRLTNGLPSGKIGRIGLDIYRRNPAVLYAIVENANLRPATAEEEAQDKRRGVPPQPRPIGGEVYRSDDGGETWHKMNAPQDNIGGKAPYSFNQLRIDPNDDQKIYVTSVSVAHSFDGGRTWRDLDWPPTLFPRMFGDVRTIWIDPENSDRIFLGSDGGVHISYDGGQTCDHFHNLPLGEFYAIAVDMEEPYNVYGGMQDHDSWKGPSNGPSGYVSLEDWVTVGTQDGMYNQVDPNDSRWVYNTFQFGGHSRVDQKLGLMTSIVPRREPGKPAYRWNWTPPLIISPHNSQILYTGAEVLLRSLDRGDHWQEISPDLTRNDPKKTAGRGSVTYCTITTISESPLKPGLIWVGTDDGKVWVTQNGGVSWTDVSANLIKAGAPDERWVSRVLASFHKEGRAYVTKTGLRHEDFRPYVFKTEDYGTTWKAITQGLPERSVNVIFEDRKNPNLLFVGTDGGVYVSLDGGDNWVRFKSNLPTARVSDLLVHPRENDLVVATYGRGLYITDISALQELTAEVVEKDVHLFSLEPVRQRITRNWGNYQLYGDRVLVTPNEPNAVTINYYLKRALGQKVKIIIKDPYGNVLRELEGPAEAGINRVRWDMRADRAQGEAPGIGSRPGRGRLTELVEPGEYVVVLEASGQILQGKALIKGRLSWAIGPFPVLR
jgi:photosystem II stability/assembly factor-like uncharacterized protein